MSTQLCRELGMEVPVFAFAHSRDVVAAVSRAGGCGVLGIAGLTAEQIEADLSWIDGELDGAPYGVDVLFPSITVEESAERPLEGLISTEHRRFVEDLLESHGVPQLSDVGPLLTRPPGREHAVSQVQQALEHPVRIVASAMGAPPAELVDMVHERGAVVAGVAGSTRHAERQRDAGVDVIVAQGHEAGGHTGEVTTMVLVPEVVDAVAPLPVLAAGGIACGRQLAAALTLGAQGAWTGSVWLTTDEANTEPVLTQKFLAATSRDTVRSRSTSGKPARQLRSAWTEAWDGDDSPGALPMPLQGTLAAEARERIRRAAPNHPGAADLITYYVGQVVGSMNELKSVSQVMSEMIEECADVLARTSSSLR
ncbi:MAG: nitronate monooxygenase family protein [Acidimicrobiales bacterium]